MLSTMGTSLQPAAIGDRMIAAAGNTANPWVSDHVLLNLSLWWVQNTGQAGTVDLPGEVSFVFHSLQQELQ